jgi:hypothetical protein
MPLLQIIRGPDAGSLFALDKEQTVLGRSHQCDIYLASLAVSRQHSRITRRGSEFVLEDAQSSSGTYVNGLCIRGEHSLEDGDGIQIGPYIIGYQSPEKPRTEADWLGLISAQAMLSWFRVKGKAKERNLRLFAAACCRWFNLQEYQGRRVAPAVELIERLAEAEGIALPDADHCPLHATDAWQAAERCATWAFEDVCAGLARHGWSEEFKRVDGVLRHLIRDVLGNPFRLLVIDADFLEANGGEIVRLTWAAFEHLSWRGSLDNLRLSVLADALEESGCTNADLVEHLRGWGPHFRGCCALDALLTGVGRLS